jgi:hypothetical protein
MAAIRAAGFVDVTIHERTFGDSTIAQAAAGLDIDPAMAQSIAYSAGVGATKPG